ncbi:hypothetical protein B0A49_03016 [Cryomyces minteri]|uniref:Uncharacterized protein n=1 Tax=Cryomyces minteri TaxID=331657 RepID=A0A4U0XBI3_9PEZI|nr:hypothetical protein B0A49_03016 [Cryomyces minteri]
MSSVAVADAPLSRHAAPRSSTALQSAKQNVAYLLHPDKEHAPKRFRTRAFLRTFRYFAVFAFWRLVRYAKYVAVGALTAAVAGSVIGSVISGAAFIVAPTGILGGAGVDMGKLTARTQGKTNAQMLKELRVWNPPFLPQSRGEARRRDLAKLLQEGFLD